jgi:hypothetical protein
MVRYQYNFSHQEKGGYENPRYITAIRAFLTDIYDFEQNAILKRPP